MTIRPKNLVAHLVQIHTQAQLTSYKLNLLHAVDVINKGLLPDEDGPAIGAHLATLQNYLARIGRPYHDKLLLRYGLVVPGMQRGISPPLVVLDENRGGFSTRRLDQAAGAIERLRQALAIGRKLIPNLASDTKKAIDELASLAERPYIFDGVESLRFIAEFTAAQVEEFAAFATDLLDSPEQALHKAGMEMLQNLAVFGSVPLSQKLCQELISRHVLRPGMLYRDAGDAVARHLISLITDAGDLLELNNLLLALAWTRSSVAERELRLWCVQQPSWAAKLNVAPESYLQDAGWCLDESGRRRDLITTRCRRLLLTDCATGPDAVPCRTPAADRCPSCGGPLNWLFDFRSLGAEEFLADFAEAPRRVLCCLHCANYGPVYSSYGVDGTASWHARNEKCEFAYSGERESYFRRLDNAAFPPFANAKPVGREDASTFGGAPAWCQDAVFPPCLDCGRLMMFLAQHDNSAPSDDGIHHSFFCSQCHVAAVSFQQT